MEVGHVSRLSCLTNPETYIRDILPFDVSFVNVLT